jgi:hypothetical protein
MTKRTILTGIGSYVNTHERPDWGWKGEEVDVHDDYLEEFDRVNVENGDGQEVTYERVGVNMISPEAAAQAAPPEEEEEVAAPAKRAAPAKK